MRIRAVKPIFWRDRELAKLGDEARLFYIGLWMEADDAGYFRWNVDEIGADLYPFIPEKARLRKITRCVESLDAMDGQPRLEVMPCGHARLTRFVDHQKAGGGSRITTFYAQHERCPRLIPTNPDKSDFVGTYGTGTGTMDRDHMGRDTRDGSKDPEKAWRELGEKWNRKPRVAQA